MSEICIKRFIRFRAAILFLIVGIFSGILLFGGTFEVLDRIVEMRTRSERLEKLKTDRDGKQELVKNLNIQKESLEKQISDLISEVLKALHIKSYSGESKNGMPHGKGKAEYYFGDNHHQNGIYEGDFKNGLRHGKGKMNFENGNWYEGEYFNGMADGSGIFFDYESEEIFNGEWKWNEMYKLIEKK